MSDNSVADILEHLRESFLDEMPARIIKIEEEIMSSKDADTYDELFRMVHSLKGSAGSYNFHELTKIAHAMEDVMHLLMQENDFGTASTVDLLLKFIDILRDTTDSLIESKSSPLDIDERLGALRDLVFKERINILVVEPSKLYASLIEYSLQSLSVNFTFKEDGFPALDSLLLNKYDLLITSLECPRLNGDALIAALRLVNNFNKKIKVILVSSRDKDKITNQDDFDAVLDRKTIKDGGLNAIVKSLIANF
jgi:HPt (histidine-containing phosphotransfer) domain-containing protein/CheY-like chemotaxis protein